MVIENPFFKSIILAVSVLPFNIISGIYAFSYLTKTLSTVQKNQEKLFSSWLTKPINGNWNFFESDKIRWLIVYKFMFSVKKNEDNQVRLWKKKFRVSITIYILTLTIIGILLLFGQVIFQTI